MRMSHKSEWRKSGGVSFISADCIHDDEDETSILTIADRENGRRAMEVVKMGEASEVEVRRARCNMSSLGFYFLSQSTRKNNRTLISVSQLKKRVVRLREFGRVK